MRRSRLTARSGARCRSLAMFFAMTTTVVVTPSAAAATPVAAVRASAVADAVWVTPAQHEAAVAHDGDVDFSVVGPGPSAARAATVGELRPGSPTSSPYSILWDYSDEDGTETPIRRGNSEWGYTHYSGKHNLYTPGPIAAALRDEPYSQSGARLQYRAYLTDLSTGKILVTVRVVVQAATRTADGRFTMPDGKFVGVITAFCEGSNVCPELVNNNY